MLYNQSINFKKKELLMHRLKKYIYQNCKLSKKKKSQNFFVNCQCLYLHFFNELCPNSHKYYFHSNETYIL